MEIWINPDCSKCRVALDTLDDAGASYTVRRYLDDPPTAAELEAVLQRLDMQPWEVARLKEPIAVELGLLSLERSASTRGTWVAALVEHPILIQRPIVTAEDGIAVVARDDVTLRRVVETA